MTIKLTFETASRIVFRDALHRLFPTGQGQVLYELHNTDRASVIVHPDPSLPQDHRENCPKRLLHRHYTGNIWTNF